MKNFVQSGDVMNYTNSTGSDIASGDVVQVGNQICIAAVNIADGESGALNTSGVYSVAKVGSQAWAQGDDVFYDHTNKRFTKTASSDADTLGGIAFEAVGSGAGETTGLVKLPGGSAGGTAKAAAVAALTGTLTGSVDGAIADVSAVSTSGGNTYADSAINTAITSINLQHKEIQTTLNAVIAALKAAGIMDN